MSRAKLVLQRPCLQKNRLYSSRGRSCLAALTRRWTPVPTTKPTPAMASGVPSGPSDIPIPVIATPLATPAAATPTPAAVAVLLVASFTACPPDLRPRLTWRMFSGTATTASTTAAMAPAFAPPLIAALAPVLIAEARLADFAAARPAEVIFRLPRLRLSRAFSKTTLLGALARAGALATDLT